MQDREIKCYAQVIVDVNHANLDRIFDYAVPESMLGALTPGYRILVPFGRGNKPIEGYVIALSNTTAYDPSKTKSIIRMLEEYPVFNEDQIALAHWMSEAYHCLLVDALRLMIPAQLRGGQVREKQTQTVCLLLDEEGLQQAEQSLMAKNGSCKAPLQREVLRVLQAGELDVSDVNTHIQGASSAIRTMAKKGWLEIRSREIYRTPYQSISKDTVQPYNPTEEQQKAIDAVNEAIDAKHGTFILKGVTGSGKTEVYLQCISHCIEQNRTAIMLVPEISLTPQTVTRFRSRFGNDVAVLHSRLSSGEHFDEWRRIRLGQVKVVVGARSAVFAPFENIGLIVIDEEHETSYQSDKTPRYHATQIASKRCNAHGAVLLLGSATPSLDTWYQAQQGEIRILRLEQRINGKSLPDVEIVDMRTELAQGNRSMFSGALYAAMKECYLSGQQMILFLNRRGYSTFVSCRGCGEVLKCSSCDVSMTYHKTNETVRCHYCGAQNAIPPVCPVCGMPYLKQFGVGTQQVEEQVSKLFPGIRVLRMDYDTTRKKDAHLHMLESFRKREADVLIGTQMIAKGLDFPEVTLVGVVAADAALHVPDYRSAERAFQLLTQVAGRAGRDRVPGRVFVQSYTPQHPSIELAAKHDYDQFYEIEIKNREQSEFPPFADFVRFLFSGQNKKEVEEQCKGFGTELESVLQACMEQNQIPKSRLLYVSSHASPIQYLRDEYRYQTILKMKRDTQSSPIFMRVLSAFARQKRVQGIMPVMEVNPQNMS